LRSIRVVTVYLRHGGYVLIGVTLFVYWQDYAKAAQPIFTKLGGKDGTWPRKKRLDFGGRPNPDHTTLGLELGRRYGFG